MAEVWFPGASPFADIPAETTIDTFGFGGTRRGDGLRVRLGRIPGVTTTRALATPLYLPVVLNDLTIEEEFAWNTYSTISSGDFALPAGGADPAEPYTLRAIDFETLTLDWQSSWMVEADVDPDFLRAELYRIARSKTPFRVYATLQFGEPPEIGGPSEVADFNARITRISRVLKHGENDTRYMTLTLEEWRDARILRSGDREGRDQGANKLPLIHHLDVGDTLNTLSKMYYGNYSGWRDIAKANGLLGKVGPSTPLLSMPWLGLRIGSSIKIPKPK